VLWPACDEVPFIKAGRVPLAAGRSSPSAVIEGAGIEGRCRRPCGINSKVVDARDEAEATAQRGQYPQWRRRVEAVRLPGVTTLDTRRHAQTHLSPTFRPGMGQPDRVYPFASARWNMIFHFFYPRGRIRTHAGRINRPTRNALRRPPIVQRHGEVNNGLQQTRFIKREKTILAWWSSSAALESRHYLMNSLLPY
jgi:hypothetical protein